MKKQIAQFLSFVDEYTDFGKVRVSSERLVSEFSIRHNLTDVQTGALYTALYMQGIV